MGDRVLDGILQAVVVHLNDSLIRQIQLPSKLTENERRSLRRIRVLASAFEV